MASTATIDTTEAPTVNPSGTTPLRTSNGVTRRAPNTPGTMPTGAATATTRSVSALTWRRICWPVAPSVRSRANSLARCRSAAVKVLATTRITISTVVPANELAIVVRKLV